MAEHMAYSCWAADSAAAEIKDPFKKIHKQNLRLLTYGYVRRAA